MALFDVASLVAESKDCLLPSRLLFPVESAAGKFHPFLLHLHLLGLDGCAFFAALVAGLLVSGHFSFAVIASVAAAPLVVARMPNCLC